MSRPDKPGAPQLITEVFRRMAARQRGELVDYTPPAAPPMPLPVSPASPPPPRQDRPEDHEP